MFIPDPEMHPHYIHVTNGPLYMKLFYANVFWLFKLLLEHNPSMKWDVGAFYRNGLLLFKIVIYCRET